MSPIRSLSAVTLIVTDMARSLTFYGKLGFRVAYGGPEDSFASLAVGGSYLNLQVTGAAPEVGWGRVIVHVDDVDAVHALAVGAGMTPEFEPRDAAWGERYFHLRDPDGHELSFARPLDR